MSTINVARVVWYHSTQIAYENWSLASDAMMHGIGVNVFGSAAASITITELARSIMVLGGLIQDAIDERRNRRMAAAREEGVAEGRVEGRAEGRVAERAEVKAQLRELNARRFQEWNARRLQAEESGEPFDEPPPEPIELDLPDIVGNGARGESELNGA